jgi:alpha-L-fucosidase
VPPATAFNPTALNASNWVAAAAATGAGYTLLVASHCSGFLQWQSNVTLPDGTLYPYSTVQATTWRGGRGDVVNDYVAASRAAGVGFGFYLTFVNAHSAAAPAAPATAPLTTLTPNPTRAPRPQINRWNYKYLFRRGPRGQVPGALAPGQIALTDAEYAATMFKTIEEVWSRYPNAITEVWFDGGEKNDELNALKMQLQPNAIAADGTQLPNVARLVGKESGYAGYPVWSTADAPDEDGAGSPDGAYFVPAEADTTVSLTDLWFWKPTMQYRALAELKSVYRNTVGANALLEMGVFPDDTGNIPADQFAVLTALGDYVRACHSPAAALASAAPARAPGVAVSFASSLIDRVILQEDLTAGENVLSFDVYASAEGGYARVPVLVASGTAVGHKRILYFASGPIVASSVSVNATAWRAGVDAPSWRALRVYAPCAAE